MRCLFTTNDIISIFVTETFLLLVGLGHFRYGCWQITVWTLEGLSASMRMDVREVFVIQYFDFLLNQHAFLNIFWVDSLL